MDDRIGTGRGLTAAQLIELLRRLAPETLVVISGQYGGFAPVVAAEPVALLLHVNHDPDFGPHERAGPHRPGDTKAIALLCDGSPPGVERMG